MLCHSRVVARLATGKCILTSVKSLKLSQSFSVRLLSTTHAPFADQITANKAARDQLTNAAAVEGSTDAAEAVLDSGADNASQAVIETVSNGLSLVEPTLSSIGLAHAWPSGWIQAIMEVIHVHGGLPWWATIATGTVMVRLLVFPMMVKMRKTAVIQNNVAPQLQRIQLELQQSKEREETLRLSKELQEFCTKNNISLFAPMKTIALNGFVFASMFFGIRGMASAPVESMKWGGLGWFTDLTVSDPIYLLPVLTASTLALNMHINGDGMDTNSMPPMLLKFCKILPWISLPVMMQFPSALNVYWFTNNVFVVSQAFFLRQKSVKRKLGIGEMVEWRDEDLPMKSVLFGGALGGGKKGLADRVKEEQEREDAKRRLAAESWKSKK